LKAFGKTNDLLEKEKTLGADGMLCEVWELCLMRWIAAKVIKCNIHVMYHRCGNDRIKISLAIAIF